jgi:hypothetical protein
VQKIGSLFSTTATLSLIAREHFRASTMESQAMPILSSLITKKLGAEFTEIRR